MSIFAGSFDEMGEKRELAVVLAGVRREEYAEGVWVDGGVPEEEKRQGLSVRRRVLKPRRCHPQERGGGGRRMKGKIYSKKRDVCTREHGGNTSSGESTRSMQAS